MAGELNDFALVRTIITGMDDKPTQPPEGALLQRALIRNRLTGRAAADKAGMSEGRWRQIVNGYQSARGQHIPVTAPAATLARMAQAAGVTAAELRAAGRDDAAETLDDLTAHQANNGIDITTQPGGETHATQAKNHPDDTTHAPSDNPALVRVMRSDLPDSKKRMLVKMLIAEQAAAERQQLERAEQLIRLVESDD